MKVLIIVLSLFLIVDSVSPVSKRKISKKQGTTIPNPLINYDEFQKIVVDSSEEREEKRLTEDSFLRMMGEDKTILLDARSENRYHLRHIKGAFNLPFTEFTEDSLGKLIPDKDTKILIYCNNNFEGSPESFAAKAPAASLNLSTYTSLKAYGYKNIYELGPLLDVRKTKIPFAGTELEK
ncbi:rhodanese-like domain-containing protein [Leptospira sp. 'Mane']|uniref:rhodanese-like domain-containing protein n=1 Tax=Leptospira sp. 'Mane' TaxID=3387407 RepID=UPI00398B7E9F